MAESGHRPWNAGLDHQGSMAGEARVSSKVLDQLRRLVVEATPEDLPSLAGALEEARARCWARLNAPPTNGHAAPPAEDSNVSVATAAGRLGMSPSYIYKNAKSLPFIRRIGSRVLCSAKGLTAWNRRRTSAS